MFYVCIQMFSFLENQENTTNDMSVIVYYIEKLLKKKKIIINFSDFLESQIFTDFPYIERLRQQTVLSLVTTIENTK
jgi:hypothetical protein